MPRIPSERELGERPVPRPTRGVADYSGASAGVRRVADIMGREADQAGAGARAIAKGLSNLGADIAAVDRAEDRLALTRATSRAQGEIIKHENAFANDRDYTTYETRFNDNISKAFDPLRMGLPEHLRGVFDDTLSDNMETARARLRSKATKEYRDQTIADVETMLTTNMESLLQVQDERSRADLLATSHELINSARDMGFFSDVEAAKRKRQYATDFAEGRFSVLPPEQRLKALREGSAAGADGTPIFNKTNTSLDIVPTKKRVEMIAKAENEVAEIQRERNRLAEKAERDADKRMKAEGDQALSHLYGAFSDAQSGKRGPVTRAEVDSLLKHRGISPSEYHGALKMLDGDDGRSDDPNTIARLTPRLDGEDISRELTREFEAGKLKSSTYRTMMGQNRNNLKDDKPASPFKSGRSFLTTSLDPGQISSDPTVRQPLAMAQARALADYDAFFEQNPQTDRQTAIQKANELTASYQNVAFGQMRLSLPRPRGFSGSKTEIQQPDIDRARTDILTRIDGGTLSPVEGGRELQMLEVWERLLSQPAKTPPKPKVPAK